MKSANVYLVFNGNCEDAFRFYSKVFGKEIGYIGYYSNIPKGDASYPANETDAKKVMHVSLATGNGTVIMGCDSGGAWAREVQFGNNFFVSLQTESKDEADSIYNKLSVDGIQHMKMQHTFWGSYFGTLQDAFGVNWMISFDEVKE